MKFITLTLNDFKKTPVKVNPEYVVAFHQVWQTTRFEDGTETNEMVGCKVWVRTNLYRVIENAGQIESLLNA